MNAATPPSPPHPPLPHLPIPRRLGQDGQNAHHHHNNRCNRRHQDRLLLKLRVVPIVIVRTRRVRPARHPAGFDVQAVEVDPDVVAVEVAVARQAGRRL